MPRLLNLRQMEAFRAVMLTGTTTQAAAMLGITQPAVSRLIGDMGVQAGFPLFLRAQGRLRPTPEAEALYSEIERAYVGLDHIASVMQGIRRSAGRLRLLATMPMAHGLLPEAVRRFRRGHGETAISLKTVIHRDIRPWLETQQFDLALTNMPLDYPASATEPLARTPAVCIMPPEHPLAAKTLVEPADIDGLPFVAMAPETQHRLKVDRALAQAGVRPDVVIEAQTGILICDFVAAGLGLSITDPFTARAAGAAGVICRPFAAAIAYEFGLLLPIQNAPSREVVRFCQLVRAIVAEWGFAPSAQGGQVKA